MCFIFVAFQLQIYISMCAAGVSTPAKKAAAGHAARSMATLVMILFAVRETTSVKVIRIPKRVKKTGATRTTLQKLVNVP